MANDYLVYKWKLWFKALDVQKDGKLTKADVAEDEDKFAHLHHFGTEKKKEVIGQLDKWWNKYIFRGKPGPILEQEFVEMQNNDFKANKAEHKKWVEACVKTIIDILDIEHDGTITEDEFLIAFKSAGHENVKLDKEFFNQYGQKDGKIPVQKMADSWIQFLSSEDSWKTDIVKDAFEKGV